MLHLDIIISAGALKRPVKITHLCKLTTYACVKLATKTSGSGKEATRMASSNRKLTFALVVRNAPWWNVGIITQKILANYQYEVDLTQSRSEDHQIERVASGDAQIGIVADFMANWAFNGTSHYQGRPRPELRAIAFVDQPMWMGFAVKRDTHIKSFEDIRDRQFPLRLYTYKGSEITGGIAFVIEEVLKAYDISVEKIEQWGGHIWTDLNGGKEAVRDGNFDAFFKHVYPTYGPVGKAWQEATILNNLRFLAIKDEVLTAVTKRHRLRPGILLNTLLKGVDADVPAIFLKGHTIYVSERLDDETAYLIASSYCKHSDEFLMRYVPFGYNPLVACRDAAIPLHPGAERFYRENRYLP
jgi:TRAP transporter TAXI family solute receptor